MNKKNLKLLGIGTGIIGAIGTVVAVKKIKDNNESPLDKIENQVNIINEIATSINSYLYQVMDIKDGFLPQIEKSKRMLFVIKKIQNQIKILEKLKEIEEVPEEIADIYEDLEATKEILIDYLSEVDIFSLTSFTLLEQKLLIIKNSIECILVDIQEHREGEVIEGLEKYLDNEDIEEVDDEQEAEPNEEETITE